jgi:N5-(cytidine 5'-diphosphoramidyl)-L-glutamine hydrolase
MRAVLVSQRVEILPDRNERRDALDQGLVDFFFECGFVAIPVPNHLSVAQKLIQQEPSVGVILSGGNDLAAHGGDAPERDATEDLLVSGASTRGIPVLGICRGFQFLVHRSGGVLVRAEGHVACRHVIHGAANRTVNSFHDWAVSRCGDGWEVQATAADGTVELAGCPARQQWGLMWHPEREAKFSDDDVSLVREILNGAGS